jgi:hypothetical protein
MAFGFLKTMDFFQIHPNLYIPRSSQKTGKSEYSKKFGSLWGFSLTIGFLFIVVSYLSDKLYNAASGTLD